MEGSDRPSGASIRSAQMPPTSASSRMRSSSTVFPAPRKPTIKRLLLERPILVRSNATCAMRRISSRPASSGGGVPAPGAYGLLIGSTGSIYSKVSHITMKL